MPSRAPSMSARSTLLCHMGGGSACRRSTLPYVLNGKNKAAELNTPTPTFGHHRCTGPGDAHRCTRPPPTTSSEASVAAKNHELLAVLPVPIGNGRANSNLRNPYYCRRKQRCLESPLIGSRGRGGDCPRRAGSSPGCSIGNSGSSSGS